MIKRFLNPVNVAFAFGWTIGQSHERISSWWLIPLLLIYAATVTEVQRWHGELP